MSHAFCPVPWISISTKPNGTLRLCCHANTSKSKGFHKSISGDNFNLKSASIEDARNSQLAKDVRLSMLNNVPHEMCTRCNREDEQGVRSRRQYENIKWGEKFNIEDAKLITKSDGELVSGTKLLHLDVRFGNLCNLTCRMCGPTDSSSWYKEYFETLGSEFADADGVVEIYKNSESGKFMVHNDSYSWHAEDSVWSEVEKHLPFITEYYFAGGEPLLIQKHYQLLEKRQEYFLEMLMQIQSTNLYKNYLKIWEVSQKRY